MPTSYIDRQLRNEIGKTVRAKLEKLGLSQEQAAKLLGINRTALNRALNGHSTPRGEVLAKMCDVLKVSIRVGDKELCATDFQRRLPDEEPGAEPRQYTLLFDEPIHLRTEAGTITLEVGRKPNSEDLELRVRLSQTRLAS